MRSILTYAATIAAILLTSQAAVAGALFPKVVVTVRPLKPYTDAILAGHGEAQSLLRPGQDAHDFALTPSQAKMLAEADVVIVPDLAMSPVLKRLLAKNKKSKVIELTQLSGAAPLPYAADNPWLEEAKAKAGEEDEDAPKADGATPPNDPHVWLDPERMAAIALPLADAISTTALEAKPALEANANALAKHLRGEVIPALRTMLSRDVTVTNAMQQAEIPFITYHAGYQYFLKQFGLKHYGEITVRPEEVMGAKTATHMLGTAQQRHIRCITGEQKTPLMERIAKSSGAKIILLSPEQLPERKDVDALDWMQNDYDRFLYATSKAFAGCL